MTYILPTLYLLGYAILHSILAMDRIKDILYPMVSPKYYRLLYSILSTVLLIPLSCLPWPSGTLYRIPYPWAWGMHTIQVVGLLGFVWTIRHTHVGEFLGWAHLKTAPQTHTTLVTTGPYQLCRHPLYFFGTLTFIAHPEMSHSLLLVTLWLILYFWIGSYFEERRLVHQFGNRYGRYQAATPRLIPFI